MNGADFSVLILDDEYLVRELLKRSVSWDELNLTICGEASSAREALDIIEEQEPDIVFADICMPVMDGIEFSRIVLEKFPQIRIIILTGHDEFEYARDSIKIGISDFLLKPIDGREISKVLLKVRKELLEERSIEKEQKRLKVQIQQSLPCLKERIYNDLLFGLIPESDAEETLRFYGVEFHNPTFQAALMIPGAPSGSTLDIDPSENSKEEQRLMLRMRCLHMIEDYFLSSRSLSVFLGPRGNIILLSNEANSDFSALCENIQNQIVSKLNCSLPVGIGSSQEGLRGIALSYNEARSALEFAQVEGKNGIILFSDVHRSPSSQSFAFNELIAEFSFSIGAGLTEKSKVILDSILRGPDMKYQKDILSVRISASAIVSVLLNTLMNAGLSSDTVFQNERQPFEVLFQIESLPEMKSYLHKLCKAVLKSLEQMRDRRVSKLVQDVSIYLQDNFHDNDLSQTAVARHFNANSSYLSRKFKQETGESFVEYLSRLRLEEALNLFKNSDKRNYEIADAVGIADPHYFSIFFKRQMGMSVSEYRKELEGV